MQRFLVLALILAAALFAGCKSRPVEVVPFGLPVPLEDAPPPPSYALAASMHNERIANIDRLWAATDLKLEWIEDEEHKIEQGSGNLLLIRPDQIALTIGKLGHVRLWAGMNPTADYLFDLRGDGVVYIHRRPDGRPADIFSPDLPVPLQPRDVPWLLGIMPLPETGNIEVVNGYWLLEPEGVPTRLLLNPHDLTPFRIDRIGPDGTSSILAIHSNFLPVDGIPGPTTLMARRLQIVENGKEARIDLDLDRLRGGQQAQRKLRPAAFDLDRLIKSHEPGEVVELQ
ncbi:hypothetical protein [Mucisphaera calidilacus]|uniref:DUF4292 domain-containing protein n=1 Tax=Mucisphaera calidilacus TaxID=2527982 RepID=A0A518BWF4_9BACT|nr:hypothetical protein [Mucisphaera calidilacus]QDU71309.1 hypothetical protein Pan265_11580 [Mucisphaera calidilacus]